MWISWKCLFLSKQCVHFRKLLYIYQILNNLLIGVYFLLFAGITEAGFTTESSDYGSSGSPTWNLLLRRTHMREGPIFALIQMHGRRCARYGLSNISCLFYHFTLVISWSTFGFISKKETESKMQDNFVVHYEALEKRPPLPQH